eukprot:9076601-Pyramimonas_sp.AAC.1
MKPEVVQSNVGVEAAMFRMRKITRVWETKTNADCNDKVYHFLRACGVIIQCAMKDERQKPNVNEARWARKTMFVTMKEDGPSAELAKAMIDHPAGKAFMKVALDHAQIGVEDAAASNGFEFSLDRFEGVLGPVFDDVAAWLETGQKGKAMD